MIQIWRYSPPSHLTRLSHLFNTHFTIVKLKLFSSLLCWTGVEKHNLPNQITYARCWRQRTWDIIHPRIERNKQLWECWRRRVANLELPIVWENIVELCMVWLIRCPELCLNMRNTSTVNCSQQCRDRSICNPRFPGPPIAHFHLLRHDRESAGPKSTQWGCISTKGWVSWVIIEIGKQTKGSRSLSDKCAERHYPISCSGILEFQLPWTGEVAALCWVYYNKLTDKHNHTHRDILLIYISTFQSLKELFSAILNFQVRQGCGRSTLIVSQQCQSIEAFHMSPRSRLWPILSTFFLRRNMCIGRILSPWRSSCSCYCYCYSLRIPQKESHPASHL